MRLAELNPEFLGNGGDGVTEIATGKPVPWREGVALAFDCPCGDGRRVCLMLRNPLDGGPPIAGYEGHNWQRTGDAFETLTLTPSIQRADQNGCRWHGFITNGEIVNA